MFFLCAQPDDFYFAWQVELLIFNLAKLNIKSSHIHILIAYDEKRGLQQHFSELIGRNSRKASFYTYPDTRKAKKYMSSIRPHIIKKHFKEYPELKNETMLYHDSDIIFRRIPNLSLVSKMDCYVSDTREYLNSRYIIGVSNKSLFLKMCSIIGVDPKIVIKNDENCGGAQYVFKGLGYKFWRKIESDSEKIFALLEEYNKTKKNQNLTEVEGIEFFTKNSRIQSWCADMWALFWNLLLKNISVKISPELEFAWAFTPKKFWYNVTILHYTGASVDKKHNHFDKSKYLRFSPFYDDFANIAKNSCSQYLIQQIKEFVDAQKRIDLTDVTFLIPVRIDSKDRLDNLKIILKFLTHYFKTNVIILESDVKPNIKYEILPSSCQYYFREDTNRNLHRTYINNLLINYAQTEIIALLDCDVIIPVEQIVKSVKYLRNNFFCAAYPYSGCFVNVDFVFKEIFSKILDPEVLKLNYNKFHKSQRYSYGGIVFLNRKVYIKSGMDNENIKSWGPEDMERAKRYQILGYEIFRTEGDLYHLPHKRLHNSGYESEDTYVIHMMEYLKIASMDKNELQENIKKWPWAKKTCNG